MLSLKVFRFCKEQEKIFFNFQKTDRSIGGIITILEKYIRYIPEKPNSTWHVKYIHGSRNIYS